jgi:radical SAM superfamily enzyme
MYDEYEELINEALTKLQTLEPGSEEHSRLAKALADLERAVMEEKKYNLQLTEHYAEMAKTQKEERSNTIRTAADVLVNVLKIGAVLVIAGSTMKFEETGAVRSTALKWAPKIF